MAKSETALEKRFNTELAKIGVRTVKGNAMFNKGFPDRMVFADKVYYVELKNDTYYGQTKLQKEWQRIIEQSRGTYYLLNGDAEVEAFIKMIKEKVEELRCLFN